VLRGEPGLCEGVRAAGESFRCGVEVRLWAREALMGETRLLVTDVGCAAAAAVLSVETRRSAEGVVAARAP
jgi:hypothetical protein